MTTPTHYFNFKPCDQVVQWDETNGDAIASALGYGHRDWTRVFNRFLCAGWRIEDGQWLVRQDGKVWVQDEEPPRVERWEQTTELRSLIHIGTMITKTRRPVVVVGAQEWLGPREAVDE